MPPHGRAMKNNRLLGPMLLLLGAFICAPVPLAPAAPPHPDLLRTLTAEELAALPAEPHREVTSPAPGVHRVATREGRSWTGHPRLLVVLVDFDDHPADREARDPAYFERLLFSRDEMEFGSLREYYLEVSYGAMDVIGGVHGWYRMDHERSYYTAGSSGLCSTCYLRNARYLALDAVQKAVDAGVDFTPYDNDGPDGVPSSGDDNGSDPSKLT